MCNAQLKSCYNVQIVVDRECIIRTVFQDRNNIWSFVPFLKTVEEKLEFRYPSVTPDSGYENEEGYAYLRETERGPIHKTPVL